MNKANQEGIDIDNKIYVFANQNNKAILKFAQYNIKTTAYIGKNGVTRDKKEGDGKTPIGEFELGIMLGTHANEKNINEQTKIEICPIKHI